MHGNKFVNYSVMKLFLAVFLLPKVEGRIVVDNVTVPIQLVF